MVGRESKRPLGPLFLTEAKFDCQTLRFAKRDMEHPIGSRPRRLWCRGSSVVKGSAIPAGVFTLLSRRLMGVYFRYFLDPDQGQTGPVSWEVAPLPPPRPVLTRPLSQADVRRISINARVTSSDRQPAVLCPGLRLPPILQSTPMPLAGRPTRLRPNRPVRLNASGFKQDLAGASGC